MSRITVLMSTYNGEKYISDQIDSILDQVIDKDISLSLYIRDDGSSDNTVGIIRSYCEKYPEVITLVTGTNIGWRDSFASLLMLVRDNKSDFYAYSDQDDIWDKNKLQAGINYLLKYEDIPALYCCSARMVNDNLQHVGDFNVPDKSSLESEIIKSKTLGCTQIFNKKLYQLISKLKPGKNIAHDWWTIASCYYINGKVLLDTEEHMSYRQSGSNVFGGSQGLGQRTKTILGDSSHKRSTLCNALIDTYQGKNIFVSCLAEYSQDLKCKLRLLFSSSLYSRTSIQEKLFLKLYILLNKA